MVIRHRSNRRALGATLRYFRESAGLSQEELGYAARLHRTYVGAVERGERNPSFESIDRILYALRISWEKFGSTLDEYSRLARH